METIIASGPVIIEDNKVLLNREQKDYGVTDWLFPGGKLDDPDENLEVACKREVKEEMGLEIKIIKKLKTVEVDFRDNHYILHHYLAERIGEIKPGHDIVEWAWHDIDNLPDNCAYNVIEIIKDYKNML